MAAIFQLRRGSGSVSLVDGELYVNKGIDSLQYAVGDREITLLKLDELNTGTLNLNGGISASGDITASNAYISGNIVLGGTITIGDNASDSVIFNADLSSSIIPDATSTYDLGSTTKVYRNIYASNVSASAFTGSLFGMGDPTSFSTSVDTRLDYLEVPFSTSVDSRMDLLENAMSGSKRLYVSPEGSDTNNGTQQSPFKTIKAAVESLYPIEPLNPLSSRRYTIFVGSGNYTEQNPIVVPPGVAIVGDTLRTVRLTASNPTKDFFHVHDSNYFYGLRFLDLKHPAFCFSFPSSTATGSISAGGIGSIGVVHSMTGYTDGNNQDLGIIIEGPDNSGSIATATANVVGGVITQINVVNAGTNYSANEKPHISIPAPVGQRPVITTSPYVQNCSSITGPFNTSGVKVLQALPYDEATFNIDEQGAGAGIRIDGNLVHPSSPLESFVADAFTQVNQGGPGHLVINKGYAQFVSCFTTFCTYGFKVGNGGFANISNSVIDFGKYGLVSKTYFPQTYNTGSSLETKTSQVSGFIIDENGAGYTGSIAGVTISGGGASVQATAEANVNANGSIDGIVLLTGGSGYTSQPNVTIDAPTGAGAIQATTVAGKGLISGVTEILMSLESGSRGIDISSNMILNGVDYLVTDVAAVGGQPNQRRVTTYPAPPSITTNDQIRFHQLSNISTGGLVMEYVGSGVTYNALPKFGGVAIRTREINEFAPGRVFYSTVDNIGNLKIGDFFAVNQLTGEVTIDANSFNLSGLNAIGPFRRNGAAVGAVLQELSNNTTLLNSQGLYGEDTAPTQYAVKEYIDPISASLDSRLDNVETFTASISGTNAFTQSANGRLNNLESKSSSVDVSLMEIHTYTSSLKTAIGVSGQNVTVNGDLTVNGTTTAVNSTTIQLGDNIIELNGTGVTNGGLIVKDPTAPNTISGSLLWDSTLDYWKGGIVGNESKLLLAGGDSVISSSAQLGDLNTFTSSTNTRLGLLETSTGSLNAFSSSTLSRLELLETSTGSLNTATQSLYTSASLMTSSIVSLTASVVTLQAFSGNVNTRFDNLQTYTTSVDSRFETLKNYTSSVNQTTASLNSFTESTNTRLGLLETSTGSLNTFSSSTLNRLDNLETSTGSLNTFSSSTLNRLQLLETSTGSLNLFTASAYVSFSLMTASIEDHEERVAYLEGIGGISGGNPLTQLHIFSASAKISIANLESYTSSANTRLGQIESYTSSANTRLSQIESYTSSLKSAISLNGSNVTILGDLNVQGTTTVIETNTLLVKDNIVELNYGATSTTAGFYVKDATGASTTSGSLLWNATNDNWTAGILGSEAKILTDGMGVVSGSSQITAVSTTGFATGVKTQLNSNTVVSGSQQILLSDTLGGGTSANVQFFSLGIGMVASGATGRIDASGDIVAYSTSDEKLKENIQPIQNALSKVETISGNEYNWKEEFENIHGFKGNDVGVIAQEIEKVLPQAVIDRESGYKAVNYEKIVPLLIEAIKELSLKVKELENK